VKRTAEERKIVKDVNFDRQLKDTFDSLFESPSLQKVKEANELVARGMHFRGREFYEMRTLRMMNLKKESRK
jgi:hypothetical protein